MIERRGYLHQSLQLNVSEGTGIASPHNHALVASILQVIVLEELACCTLSDFNNTTLACLIHLDAKQVQLATMLSRSEHAVLVATNLTVVEERYRASVGEVRYSDIVVLLSAEDVHILDASSLGLTTSASSFRLNTASNNYSEELTCKLTRMLQRRQSKPDRGFHSRDKKEPPLLPSSVRTILASDHMPEYVDISGLVIEKTMSTVQDQIALRLMDLEYGDSLLLYLPLMAARGIIKSMMITAQHVKAITSSRHKYLLFKDETSDLSLCISKHLEC